MRLVKFLATAGVASRRASEELIRSGRVTVRDEVVTDPARDVSSADGVAVDGRAVGIESTRVVYAVNKPAGVVSTASDPQGRRTVTSLMPGGRRLYPVGRLDIDATGLILLTDDGELAHRLTHPSFGVEKTYRVVLASPPVRERALRQLRDGVTLADGPTAPARARRVSNDTIELTIHEGRKRQVKRMCECVGHRVIRLERIRFGPLQLGDLASGAHRRLTATEVSLLRSAGGGRTVASGSHRASGSSSKPRRPPTGSPSRGRRPPAARS